MSFERDVVVLPSAVLLVERGILLGCLAYLSLVLLADRFWFSWLSGWWILVVWVVWWSAALAGVVVDWSGGC